MTSPEDDPLGLEGLKEQISAGPKMWRTVELTVLGRMGLMLIALNNSVRKIEKAAWGMLYTLLGFSLLTIFVLIWNHVTH
jgi:hypothetical protein